MTRERKRENAKFLCRAEAFHAVVQFVLLVSGSTLTILGVTFGPIWYLVSLTANTLIALALARYAWGIFDRRAQSGHANDQQERN